MRPSLRTVSDYLLLIELFVIHLDNLIGLVHDVIRDCRHQLSLDRVLVTHQSALGVFVAQFGRNKMTILNDVHPVICKLEVLVLLLMISLSSFIGAQILLMMMIFHRLQSLRVNHPSNDFFTVEINNFQWRCFVQDYLPGIKLLLIAHRILKLLLCAVALASVLQVLLLTHELVDVVSAQVKHFLLLNLLRLGNMKSLRIFLHNGLWLVNR